MTAPPVKKACDACHRRKVRCSGSQPCNNCGQANLQCTYLAIPQKKGPKGSRAKVISEIRVSQQQSASPTQKRPTSGHGLENTNNNNNSDENNAFDFQNAPTSPLYQRNGALLSQQTVDNCIDFYFNNMSTTAWILNRQSLVDMITARLAADTEVYCLVAAMCAFVMVQPGMNLPVVPGSSYEGEPPQNRYGYANMLLDDLLRVRKGIDYIENPTLNSVHVSFFLFSCYFGLEKQNLCWFHLREATTLAQIMSMHDESTYLGGDPAENRYKRRIYWLLFVTERAYAMERHRPLSLHATIELPTAQGPGEAEVISGFTHLINLFRCIDDEFMALWNKSKSDCSTAWLAQLQRQLVGALPPDLKTTESQAADVRITYHWLRIMVWQLSITNGYLSSSSPDSSMTFKYPIEVARDLIQDLQKLTLNAMEVHGVGLIEKVFDIACTLTDVIACVPLDYTVDGHSESPTEYLNSFLTLVAQLRGGASRYLPLLVAKVSENLPSMAPPLSPLPMNIKQGYAGASDHIPTPMDPTGMPIPMQFSFGAAAPEQAYGDRGLVFGTYRSPAQASDPSLQNSPLSSTPPTATYPGPAGQMDVASILAPVPRSIPAGVGGIKFESYPG